MPDEVRRAGADGSPPLAAARRTALASRTTESLLARLGPFGLLAFTAFVCALDFVAAGTPLAGVVFTALEAAAALPWAWLLFRLERGARNLEAEERRRRLRLLLVHALTAALVLATLVAKADVIARSRQGGFAELAGAYQQYVVAFYVFFMIGQVGRGSRAGRFFAEVAEHPARLMTISFGCLAVLGAFLLAVPVSLRDVSRASFLEALFNATGAVCGALSLGDVSTTYTFFGQLVLLFLIQVGGLGIMVLSAFFAIVAGRRLKMRSSAVMAEMIDADSLDATRRMIRNIVAFTVTIESVGALLLLLLFSGRPAVALGPESSDPAAGPGGVLWAAVFHSVSAFCNAGYALTHGNMVPFVGDWPVSLTICALVVLGGLGFPVLSELVVAVRTRLSGRRPLRLSLNTRVALSMGAVLTAGGALVFLAFDWTHSLRELPVGDRVLAAVFQSTSARTAGFNSVDVATVGAPSLLVLCMLMFVGGSPGSTAGGIKTTTLAVLYATLRAELRAGGAPRLFDRCISSVVVRKAVAVATVSLTLVLAVFLALLLTEDVEPLALLFETVSAFATCGLSAGVSQGLSVVGKLLIVLTMLAGRIGPLTLALAAAAASRRGRTEYPEERIAIG